MRTHERDRDAHSRSRKPGPKGHAVNSLQLATARGEDGNPRDRVMAVARRLFAEHGYEATTLRAITGLADVNLGAVRYYFSGKSALYTWVLQGIVGPMAHQVDGILRIDVPPMERIERVVRFLFDYISRNPDMPSFMVREMSAPEPHGALLLALKRVMPAMAAVIREGQKQGDIRPGDPMLMVLSTIAQPVYLYLTRKATKVALHDDRIVEHAVAFVRAGLEQR